MHLEQEERILEWICAIDALGIGQRLAPPHFTITRVDRRKFLVVIPERVYTIEKDSDYALAKAIEEFATLATLIEYMSPMIGWKVREIDDEYSGTQSTDAPDRKALYADSRRDSADESSDQQSDS